MRPTVIMKSAMTLDGQLAAADGTSQWITTPEALIDAHECRASVDAVMVGAGTVIADNPRLTVRLDGYDGAQPTPVIIAGSRPFPTDGHLFERDPIVLASHAIDVPGRVMTAPGNDGRVDLVHGLELLHGLGIRSVLVEGGAGLLASLFAGSLIDRGVLYYGQKLAGGVGTPLFSSAWQTLTEARSVEIESVRQVGGDVRVEFTFPQ
jgi:diaminohydroxyphosphoribosylaminopyrimidine deaminase/5-amino-6-(5-phosphoribosylamino)uracil reductase